MITIIIISSSIIAVIAIIGIVVIIMIIINNNNYYYHFYHYIYMVSTYDVASADIWFPAPRDSNYMEIWLRFHQLHFFQKLAFGLQQRIEFQPSGNVFVVCTSRFVRVILAQGPC